MRERLLPVLDGVKEGSDEARRGHALQLHGVVIERLHHVLDGAEDEAAVRRALHVLVDVELEAAPRVLHLSHALQGQGVKVTTEWLTPADNVTKDQPR